MSALKYLFLTTLKNKLKDIVRSPAKIFVTILLLVCVVLVLISSVLGKSETGEFRNIDELYAIIFALYYMMFIMLAFKGLSSGASFYSMADVNILFSTPISYKKILIYGIVKQLGTSLLLGFFLLFQYGWLSNTYNLSPIGMLAIFVGYGITVFCGQITAMLIYSFTSSSEKRRKIIKYSLYGFSLILAAYLIVNAAKAQNILLSLIDGANSYIFNYVPVAGWMKSLSVGIITSDLPAVILGSVFTLMYILLIVIVLRKGSSDFYEDVLKASEISFSAITAQKEGRISEAVPQNVKIGKIGIGKGKGAGVFFYKHMLEDRRSKVFILDITSIIFIAMAIAFALFMKDIIAIFVFDVYMLVFSSALGRWAKELIKPYVYLIPQSAFKKLIMISMQSVLKNCVSSVITYLIIGIILNLSPVAIIACTLARISFGILFMAGDFLAERIFGTVSSKVLVLLLYFLVLIVLAVPGVALGIILGGMLKIISAEITAFIVMFAWNTLASLILTFICKDIINYAELNQR